MEIGDIIMKLNRANSNDSASIIIPKKALKILGWQIGDEFRMDIVNEGKDARLVISKKNKTTFI